MFKNVKKCEKHNIKSNAKYDKRIILIYLTGICLERNLPVVLRTRVESRDAIIQQKKVSYETSNKICCFQSN